MMTTPVAGELRGIDGGSVELFIGIVGGGDLV